MKSHADLWPRVTSFENLWQAFRRARLGKRGRPDVAAFEFDLEWNLLGLQRELLVERYRPGGYRNFVVHEPARRKISAAPFRDRASTTASAPRSNRSSTAGSSRTRSPTGWARALTAPSSGAGSFSSSTA